jgi:uncharacterized protein (TIGR02217 family)
MASTFFLNNPGEASSPAELTFDDSAILDAPMSPGTAFGVGFATNVVEIREGVYIRRPDIEPCGKRTYSIVIDRHKREVMHEAVNFVIAREGSTYGFRLRDVTDFTTNFRDGTSTETGVGERHLIAVGDGTTTSFQIWKNYVDESGEVVVRKITRPRVTTVRVWVDGVEQTYGVGNDFTVESHTGVIVFDTAPANTETIHVYAEFDVPVRFGEDVDEWLRAIQGGVDDFRTVLTCEEILDQGNQTEPFQFGGYKATTIPSGESIMLRVSDGLYQEITPSTALQAVYLPVPRLPEDSSSFADNGWGARSPMFHVKNTGAADFFVFTIADVLVAQVPAGELASFTWNGQQDAKFRTVIG